MIRGLFLFLALLIAAPALAQTYPPLSGRVVDNAHVLSGDQIASLTQRLDALQRASSRQLVVATIADLGGQTIEDYGVGLGRAWGIGQRGASNGLILIVAPNERKVRIEVGYGLEGIVTDALSSQIIRNQIVPRFQAKDIAGGIAAGTDALIQQLQAPPEAAEQAAVAAQQAENRSNAARHQSSSGSFVPILFVGFVFFIILVSAIGAGLHGQRYRGKGWGGQGVSVWGPGSGGGSGLGWMLLGAALSSRSNRGWGGGSSWGSGGSDWGGGGGGGDSGGFSGGGGSFGGGGASGSW